MKKYCQTCQKEFRSKTDSHIFCSAECAQSTLPPPRYWRDIMDELRPLLNNPQAVALYGELTFILDDLEYESHRHETDAEHHKAESERYAAMIDGLTEVVRQVETGWRDWSDLSRAANNPQAVALYPLN